MNRLWRVAWLFAFVGSISGQNSVCQSAAKGQGVSVQQRAEVRQANPASNSDERSCRTFVQKFYDWYWNKFADRANDPELKLHNYHQVVRLKAPVLSPELVRLIKKDEMASKVAHGIANLDFDPFLNTQDPQGKYVIDDVTVTNQGCFARFNKQHIVMELKRSGSSWVFSNFRYGFFSEDGKTRQAPDSDLITILSQ
jgi:hypothetical protein